MGIEAGGTSTASTAASSSRPVQFFDESKTARAAQVHAARVSYKRDKRDAFLSKS